jgi:transglutaminase-like putative cysteine protease
VSRRLHPGPRTRTLSPFTEPMPVVTLTHVTTYSYAQPVQLGEHRLLVRPRESFDQRLLSAELSVRPEPTELRWLHDVFGNAVALARFAERTRDLSIVSTVSVRHAPLTAADIRIERYARRYPFTYDSEDMPDLLRSIERGHHDPERRIDDFARSFVRGRGVTDTLDLLSRMTHHIKREFTYLARYEKGTQTPLETLARRRGSCRDFAVLMIEAARALGFAARFVSGYLYDPSHHQPLVGGGNTHAWLQIFLPGSGWVEFDPTNAIVGNEGLVRVAIVRDPYQAVPISGTWRGFPSDDRGMRVSVDVHCVPDSAPSAGGEVSSKETETEAEPTAAAPPAPAAEPAPEAAAQAAPERPAASAQPARSERP